MCKVDHVCTGPAIATKREHVLDARSVKAVHVDVNIDGGCSHAGKVRKSGNPKLALNPGSNGDSICRVTRAAGRVRHRDPVRLVLSNLGGNAVCLLERHLTLGREDLKRERLPRRKLVGNPHDSPIAQK